MLNNVQLYFGASEKSSPLAFNPVAMNLFVGPNNSGKSRVLFEIENAIYQVGDNFIRKIVKEVEIGPIPRVDVLNLLFGEGSPTQPEEAPESYSLPITFGNSFSSIRSNTSIRLKDFYQGLSDQGYLGPLKKEFAFSLTLKLDGKTRLALTNPQETGDLLSKPSNHLMALFKDQKAREQIRGITNDAFGLHFVIDPTSIKMLRVRMSPRPPEDPAEEQALDRRSREFHGQAFPIEALSDGVKAYTGLIAAAFSGDFRLTLIDEPEAFLHPPLARKLGKVFTQAATRRKANVFASTHSSDFLIGCVQAGDPVNVLRLTYQNGKATARLLGADALQMMMRDPLLRSTGILNALFQ